MYAPYTAGSTGIPKGCMHTNQTHLSNVLSAYHWTTYTSSSVTLGVLPFFHVTGLVYCFLAPVLAGAKMSCFHAGTEKLLFQPLKNIKRMHIGSIFPPWLRTYYLSKISKREIFLPTACIGGGGAPLQKLSAKSCKN